MVSRNRGFSEDESAISASLSDVLLFTTMCIVGHPVDVYVKDGSIYSGTFHTACVDKEYAIVLKRARMIKKGNRDASVANKGMIETLIVQSEDLVQVVSKGVLHSEDGFTGNVSRDDVGATSIVPSTEYVEREAQTINNGKRNVDRKRISQTRGSSRSGNSFVHGSTPKITSRIHNIQDTENGKTNSIDLSKKDEASNVANARHVGDGGPQLKQGYHEEKSEYQKEQNTLEVQGTSPRIDACDNQLNFVTNNHKKITSKALPNSEHDSPAHSVVKLDGVEDTPCSEAFSSGASAGVAAIPDITSESYLSSSSTLTEMVPPKSTSSNRTAKEFKLNPGAKIFSPSFAHQRSVTPPVVPTATYIPDNSSVVSISTAQPEVEISPFAPRSLPMKFIPYGSLASGNGSSDIQYPQPIVGHLGSRTQPVRYAGQYHPVQPGTTYVHPTSQNVMVGRLGPLVYVHPVSHDVVQGAAAFSQVSTFPLLTPHQVHLPKHQGNSTTAQALQLCSTPRFVAAGQQPFTVPSHIPISQPHFPVIRPMPVPGSNGFLGSKFS